MLAEIREAGFEVVHVGPTLRHHHGPITLVSGSGGWPLGAMIPDEGTGGWQIVGIDVGGGGTSSGPGTEETSTTRPTPVEQLFVAICNAHVHPADTPGATADGVWYGDVCETFEAALAQAADHEHDEAFVTQYQRT